MNRAAAALVLCVSLIGASPAPKAPAGPRPIAIVINDVALPLEPPPRMLGGHLLVPVRRTIEALGLSFNRSGKTIWTEVGAKTVSLTLGSRIAHIDESPIVLDTAPVEVKDVLYTPLRFFTDVLGAQAVFDGKSNTVTITAELVGRSSAGVVAHGKQVERYGTVSAVDVDSDPPTVTLTYNAATNTVPISRNAIVDMHDENANVTVPGELGDVRPGDFARIYSDARGSVTRVEDLYGSYVGQVAAAAGDQFVLGDGHVIVPSRTTQVSINGKPASMSDARVGDRASIRYNVESNEVRSILLSRTVEGAMPGPGPQLTSADVDADRPLRPGDTLNVTARGAAGASATFDIGPYVSDIAMVQTNPGVYAGSYRLPRGVNFSDVPVIVHLRASGAGSSDLQASRTVSASSVPPGIADVAPAQGAVVNSSHPAIYATFVADAVPVNPSSISIDVNGRDVTSSSVRTEHYVQYLPTVTYGDGPVTVRIRVADRAGNVTTKSWSFTIHR